MCITLTAKATSQQTTDAATVAPIQDSQGCRQRQRRKRLPCVPPASPKQMRSQRWILCYGNFKRKLQERYDHYKSSDFCKEFKRLFYFGHVPAPVTPGCQREFPSPASAACTSPVIPAQVMKVILEQELSFLPQPLFFPAFLQHFGVLQGCLYSTKRNSLKKTLESLFGLC